MSIVSQLKAFADIKDHVPHLVDLIKKAWEDVDALSPSLKVVMTPRSRASLVHDHMLARAAMYADQTEGVRYFERQLMHGLVFEGKYAVRFKKLDSDSLSRNQPTTQVTEFRNQMELDGIDAAHHLEVGYVTDLLGTSVQDVRITCPSGRGNAWSVSVIDSEARPVVEDIFADVPPAEVEHADIAPRRKSADILPFVKTNDAS